MLALLLLEANRAVSTDRLIDGLWGDSPPPTAKTVLQGYVSQLRKALDSDREILRTEPAGYSLRVDVGAIDAVRFESLVAEARGALRAGDARGAAKNAEEALRLWRGSPLADFAYEEWARDEVERLEELRHAAIEERIEARLELGENHEVVGELESHVRNHPLREGFVRQLMLALYRSGRQAEALEVFQSARSRLVEEFGIDPSPELRALHRSILNHEAVATPAAPPPIRARVPVPATPLLGRERELSEIVAMVDEGRRLVTMTGPGGIGKTRLAIAATAELSRSFAETAYVELAAVRESGLVFETIARELGSPADARMQIASRRLLLVLDNVEHLLDAAADIASLVSACPNLHVLVTSRAPLHVTGEQEYPVPPLDEPAAVALFRAAAARVEPSFAANGEIVAICRRIDNLPLAVELAAARVKVLSPRAILERLERRLPLLTTGARDLPERQRTLRATIEWSYDLLAPEEQKLFAELAVFAGGCTLAASEAVCGADVDALASLIEKSLLRHDGGRFSMLETIREYALERLEERDVERLRRAHAEFFASSVPSRSDVRGSKPEALAFLDAEIENVRAAGEWAVECGRIELAHDLLCATWFHWIVRGRAREAAAWSERIVAATVGDSERDGLALASAAELVRAAGDVDRSIALKERALPILERTGPEGAVAAVLTDLAHIALERGQYDQARPLIARALAIRERLGDPWGIAHARMALSHLEFRLGNFLRAAEIDEENVVAARADETWSDVATTLCGLGGLYRRAGKLDLAAERLREGIGVAREIADVGVLADGLEEAAQLFAMRREFAAAGQYWGAAAAIRERTGFAIWDPDDNRRGIDATRAALGTQAFDAAWAAGRRLTADQAADAALERLSWC